MEAITIHLDEGHESRVISTYTPHGQIRQMVLAELDTKSKEMRITSIYPQSTSETVVLTEEAMQNLVRFYGAGDSYQQLYDLGHAEMARLHEEVAAQKDAWHEVNRDAICLRAENEALRAQVAQMQSQESFRVALLESVVSIARQMQHEYTTDYGLLQNLTCTALDDALDALDAWQPEAPPAAPAEYADISNRPFTPGPVMG